MEKQFLVPAEDRHIRDPKTKQPLAKEGEWKVMNTYWHRALRDKDVFVGEPAQAESAESEDQTN